MAYNCKGFCDPIAAQQEQLKLQFFKCRQKGARPRNISIASISKYCKTCDIRFYFVDYLFCKCCGCRMRGRTALNNMLEINEQKVSLELSGMKVVGGPTP